MNVCILISSLHIGGSSQVAVDLAVGLKNKGCNVYMISIWNLIDEKYRATLGNNGIEILTANKKGKFDFLCYKRLRKLLKGLPIDFMITNLTSIFYLWLCHLNIQTIHIIHSDPKRDIPFFYRTLFSNDIKKGKIKLVGCSKSVAEDARNIYMCDVKCITNGINFPHIDTTEKIYDFIYIGRLCDSKRLFDLIKAFEIIQKKNHDTSLCLVGEGPMKSELENYLKDNNCVNIHLVDKTANPYEYLTKSKVFCLFSVFEGGPICLLEAMHCGLPIVCSDAKGNLNFAIENKNALVFPTYDYVAASKLMLRYLEDKKLYEKHSKKSIELSKEHTSDKMVESYYEYLMSLYSKGEEHVS